MSHYEVSDKPWAIIAPFLPSERGRGCRPAYDNRPFFNGMMGILRSGSPWRTLPEKFGKWNSVFQRFRRWCRQGLFDALLETLVALGIADDWKTQMVDLTVVRGHSQAAGARGGPTLRDLVARAAALRARSTCGPMLWDGLSPSRSRDATPPTLAISNP